MPNKKLIYRIFFYLIILAIFFFFGRHLFVHWQKLKEYDFSFNYSYLFLSLVFFSFGAFVYALIWNQILRKLEPNKTISNFKAFKISVMAYFGRYIPGKLWMFLGKVYLGSKEGLAKKVLFVSVLLEIVLLITAAFSWALILLAIAFGSELFSLYFIPLIIVAGGLIFVHPKIFYPLCNFGLKKLKKTEISPESFLNYQTVIKIIFYYFIALSLDGIGLFFLINSITSLSWSHLIGVIGAYALAAISGAVAFFAPAGLGVREGVLVLILQFYFPASIAILISLLARVWLSLIELFLFGSVCLYSKFKRIR